MKVETANPQAERCGHGPGHEGDRTVAVGGRRRVEPSACLGSYIIARALVRKPQPMAESSMVAQRRRLPPHSCASRALFRLCAE